MKQSRMAPLLVVDVEATALKRRNHLFRLQHRQLWWHSERGYGMVTATRSVVISDTSLGIGSPVSSALSRKQRIASRAISRASSRLSPYVQISGSAGTTTL